MLHRILAAAAVTLAVTAAAVSAQAQQQTPQVQAMLTKLDAASAHFTSAQADFEKDLYNAVIKDTDKQNGKVYFKRESGNTQFGMVLEGANARIAEYKNGAIRDFNPATKCYDSVQASPGKIESFLTLGFGGSGRDLAKAWTINDLGPEIIDTIKTEKVDLTPKDDGVKANLTHVVLWIDVDRDVSLKQVFYTTSGDTQTAHYRNIRLNQKVDMKPFEFKGKACGK
jgi:outer membrane lipoprotein-sorting protein